MSDFSGIPRDSTVVGYSYGIVLLKDEFQTLIGMVILFCLCDLGFVREVLIVQGVCLPTAYLLACGSVPVFANY